MHILPGLAHFVIHLLHSYGVAALFALLLVEEAGVPLPAPGDTLIALAGAQPHRTLGYTIEVLALCTLAVFLGSSVLYWGMRLGGRTFLDRYGRYLHLNQQRLERIEAWVVRAGPLGIIAGRLIPGLRVPTTVMCGLSGVRYRVYAPSAALAALIWSSLYFLLGAVLRRRAGLIASYFVGLLDTIGDSTLLTGLVIALVIIAVFGGWGFYRRARVRGAMSASDDADEIGETSDMQADEPAATEASSRR